MKHFESSDERRKRKSREAAALRRATIRDEKSMMEIRLELNSLRSIDELPETQARHIVERLRKTGMLR